ncbi:hypothetical protein [Plantactinospora sp. GCM10030261]|uniref:hypothetical protein n=1 Tax=Plantactinospora sp. GCM10030261 TaxID=3273420 RepID=UPI00361E5BBA
MDANSPTSPDSTPTADELQARAEAATRYVRERINPHLSDVDLAAAERFWAQIEAGHLPSIDDLSEPHSKRLA